MLLDHPETQAILASKKHINNKKESDSQTSSVNDSESDGERPDLLPVKYKSIKKI